MCEIQLFCIQRKNNALACYRQSTLLLSFVCVCILSVCVFPSPLHFVYILTIMMNTNIIIFVNHSILFKKLNLFYFENAKKCITYLLFIFMYVYLSDFLSNLTHVTRHYTCNAGGHSCAPWSKRHRRLTKVLEGSEVCSTVCYGTSGFNLTSHLK